jgi:hypothetical protein
MYQINTLYWKNTDPIFPEYHKKIMNKFNIKVNYVNESLHHGKWMDSIMNKSKAEIIGFIDIDCVVTNAEIIHKCIKYVKYSKSIIGIAQASNHIHPCTHIFAGAGFFFINKDSWIQNGKPSFCMLKPKLKNFFKKNMMLRRVFVINLKKIILNIKLYFQRITTYHYQKNGTFILMESMGLALIIKEEFTIYTKVE